MGAVSTPPTSVPTISDGRIWRSASTEVPVRSVADGEGASLHATAVYQLLHQGQVVSTQYPSPGRAPGSAKKPYAFTGSYSDDMIFPARSVGIPLTLRVVVKVAGKGTVNLDKNVRAGK